MNLKTVSVAFAVVASLVVLPVMARAEEGKTAAPAKVQCEVTENGKKVVKEAADEAACKAMGGMVVKAKDEHKGHE